MLAHSAATVRRACSITWGFSVNGFAGAGSSAKIFPGTLLPRTSTEPVNPMAGQPAENTYEEGIYVGYRYSTPLG